MEKHLPFCRIAWPTDEGWCHRGDNWALAVAGSGNGRCRGESLMRTFFSRPKKCVIEQSLVSLNTIGNCLEDFSVGLELSLDFCQLGLKHLKWELVIWGHSP